MFEKRFTPNIYSCIMKEMMEVKEMELRQGLSIQEKLRILAVHGLKLLTKLVG